MVFYYITFVLFALFTVWVFIFGIPFKWQQSETFTCDKSEWQFDDARKEYLRSSGKKDLTMEDEEIIMKNADAHIAYFLAWIIEKGFIGEIHRDEADEVLSVKKHKMQADVFLERYCDHRLTNDDYKPELQPFMDAYYNTWLWRYDNVNMKYHIRTYSRPFSWRDYRVYKRIIQVDYRWWKFKSLFRR